MELQPIRLQCSPTCGVRLDKLTLDETARSRIHRGVMGDTLERVTGRPVPPRVEARSVPLPAERRARRQLGGSRGIAAATTATPNARGRTAPPVDAGSDRTGYRCGKCGADWQFTRQRLTAAVEGALAAGRSVIYADGI